MMKSYQTYLLAIALVVFCKSISCAQPDGYYISIEKALKEPEKVVYLHLREVKEIPSAIKKLKNLKRLSIWRGKLEELPIEIAKLKNLEEIYLSDVRIKGDIPREVATMPKLKLIQTSLTSVRFPKELKTRKDIKLENQSSYLSNGIFLAYQQGAYPVVELGIFRGYWNQLGHVGEDLVGWFLSWEKNLNKSLEGYKLGIGNSWFRLSTVYYRNTGGSRKSGFAFRPEFSLGFASFQVGIGANIAPKYLDNINRGFIRAKFNLSLFSKSRIFYY